MMTAAMWQELQESSDAKGRNRTARTRRVVELDVKERLSVQLCRESRARAAGGVSSTQCAVVCPAGAVHMLMSPPARARIHATCS